MHRSRSNIVVAASAALALALASGCTVGPHYQAPAPPAVTTYTSQPQPDTTAGSAGPAGLSQTLNSSADLPAQWWTLFQSPELDGMVRTALDHSPTLAQATARLLQAQEVLKARTGATRWPTVTGNASVEEEQLNLAAYGIPLPNPSPFTLLNGSVAVSYALDLFGGNRRQMESLRAQVDDQAWQLEGARLMLAGNVVAAAIRQAQVHAQIETTQQTIELQRQQLRITQQRFQAGGVSTYDVRTARTAFAQTQAALPTLEQQRDSLNDQLAVLMGESPAEARVASLSLDRLHLPATLPLSLPSALVRQRPDIRAAEARLHEASANVGVATANLYPQIVLSGNGGGVGTGFTSGGGIWNVGLSLAQPLYNGGALRAERRKAEAAYQEAGSAFRQTVLEAFQQVADALYAIQHDAETLRARTDAAAQADAAWHIAAARYQAGGLSRLALLDAQRQQLQTALDRSNAAAARYADSATLFQALGGGWWNAASTARKLSAPQQPKP